MTIDKLSSNSFEGRKDLFRDNNGDFKDVLIKVFKEMGVASHITWLKENGVAVDLKDISRIFRWLRKKEQVVKDPQFTLYNLEHPASNTQYQIPNPYHPIIYQIIEKIRIRLYKKRKEALIRLQDKKLGEIIVKVFVHDGKVRLLFLVEREYAKTLIEGDIGLLARSFIGLGMELREFEVLIKGDDRDNISEDGNRNLSEEREDILVPWSNNSIDYVA